MNNVTLGRVRVTIVDVEKPISITYSESVALVTQHAKRMRRIISSSMASLTNTYFHIIS